MKIPISILEASLPEYKSNLTVFRTMKTKTKEQGIYRKKRIQMIEQEIAQIEYAIELLLNHE